MRTIMQTALLTLALLLPRVCAAQGQSGNSGYLLKGPSLGLMFDSASATIRPILGIPGAATLGAPLSPGFDIAEVVVAPGGDFALVVEKHGFRLAVVRASGTVTRDLTPTLGEAPDLIAFSPRGGSAAVYFRISERLLVLTGLTTQTPRVVQADTSTLPAAPSLMAVSEDAASLLIAVPEGDRSALYFLPNVAPAGRPVRLMGIGELAPVADSTAIASASSAVARKLGGFQSVSALRFAGSGPDALLADGAANAVYLVQNASGAAQIRMLGSARDGLSTPVAIEAVDARRVLIANAGSGRLTMLYRDATQAESIACGCSPTTLQLLMGNSVYRLTEPSREPMWLLDAGGTEARIMAVPPDRSQNAPAAAAQGARR